MLADVRYLYDEDRIDCSMHGDYDDFIDWMFDEDYPDRSYIDDAISEMESWHCRRRIHRSGACRAARLLYACFLRFAPGRL